MLDALMIWNRLRQFTFNFEFMLNYPFVQSPNSLSEGLLPH